MASRIGSCIVMGGGGFIGTNLCRRLASSGARVRAFGRRRLFPDEFGAVEWYQGDFADPAAQAAAIESFDTVFHLVHSGTPQSANVDMAADVHGNIIPTLALLEICRKLGVRRVIFVSSGGTIYGRCASVPTPETAPTEPIAAYGISKLAIEKYLALYEHLHGLEYRVLRVTNPFGPFQVAIKNQGVIAAFLSKALRGESIEIWGDGSAVRDFVFVDDVIDAMLSAVGDQSEHRIFNIGSGQGRSLRDIILAIELCLGRRVEIEWLPGRPIDVPVSVVSIDRAREALGWTPRTPFEEGLRKTLAWWQRRP
jgi:UDP-glucose 4-epimerase